MKNFSLKALGAFIFAAGLVVAGVATPALATSTITATAIVVPGSTNTAETIIDFGALPTSEPIQSVSVRGLSGVTFTTSNAGSVTLTSNWQACGASSTVFVKGSASQPVNCSVLSGAVNVAGTVGSGPYTLASSDQIQVKLAAGSMSFAGSGSYGISAAIQGINGGNTVTSTPFTLTATSAPVVYTTAYSGNGGSGTSPTPGSSSSGTIVLPANTFTKSGFTFAGWRAGSATVGTVYQAGASAPLTANTTFYAQWTDNNATPAGGSSSNLANTGINSATGISLLAGGLSLALVGAEMFMIARRKRSNS